MTEYPRPRRQATPQEAKALAHPLRARILRLCARQELTNKQLADRLGISPGSVFYHVRLLLESGLLLPGEVRTGRAARWRSPTGRPARPGGSTTRSAAPTRRCS